MKHLALLVLAAGSSRRYGDDDKLLADFGGAPLLARTLRSFETIDVARKIAVVRPAAPERAAICRNNGFEIVENADADDGVGRSIAAAVAHCAAADGVMIALADMPLIEAPTLHAIIDAWRSGPDTGIVAPVLAGRRGHPVIFSACYFPDLAKLTGDKGAGRIIEANRTHFIGVSVEDEGVAIDFDERADFMTPDQDASQ